MEYLYSLIVNWTQEWLNRMIYVFNSVALPQKKTSQQYMWCEHTDHHFWFSCSMPWRTMSFPIRALSTYQNLFSRVVAVQRERRIKKGVVDGWVGVWEEMISCYLYYSMKNIMLIMSGWHIWWWIFMIMLIQ